MNFRKNLTKIQPQEGQKRKPINIITNGAKQRK